jgi:hypothetical protein
MSLTYLFFHLSYPHYCVANPQRHSSPANSLSPIRTLLPAQLAKSLECREPLPYTLKHTLGRRPNKKHKPLPHLLRLRPHTNPPLPSRANNNTRPINRLKRSFRARPVQLRLDDAELLDGRIVEDRAGGGGVGGAVEGDVGVVDRVHFLLGDGRVRVGEHGG